MPSSLWAVLLSACPVDHYSLHPRSLEPRILGFLKFHMLIPHEKITDPIFSSPEPKAQGELIVWDSSRRRCVRPFTLYNMNISETSWPIIIKFHQKHYWGGGLIALGFG